jgi:hypothetical protein
LANIAQGRACRYDGGMIVIIPQDPKNPPPPERNQLMYVALFFLVMLGVVALARLLGGLHA